MESKVTLSKLIIKKWYEYWDGEVYVALSGGKDSRVLLDLVWQDYPDTPAVHAVTGLEYPEVEEHVDTIADRYPGMVVKVRPKQSFVQVLDTHGYPIGSKKISRQVRILREHSNDPSWANSVRLYDTGIRRDGVYSKGSRLTNKWRKLLSAPFKVSELCCDVLKKEPLLRYQRETGHKPITGMIASESGLRAVRTTQCNNFSKSAPISSPLLFWTDKDIWEYIRINQLDYAKVYDDRPGGIPGETRTGCVFCLFGIHLEKYPNRLQRLRVTHPKLHAYCMDKLGMREVCAYIGVPVE
jgi:3'-phosphoadenosine 5'-phosphosulfate sulfotransferase (PAPS reductase)/FAD synthetase